jgi:hypothetical protein
MNDGAGRRRLGHRRRSMKNELISILSFEKEGAFDA